LQSDRPRRTPPKQQYLGKMPQRYITEELKEIEFGAESEFYSKFWSKQLFTSPNW